MALFQRREKPPAAAVARLAKDDRVISWADTADGGVVVASRFGIWWPEGESARLIAWQLVAKAVWAEGSVFSVVEGELEDDILLVDKAPVSVVLAVPRDLPPTVRTRVEKNIVSRELVTVPGGAVRFVSRREPGRDGLTWLAHLEPGTPDTESLRTAVRARLDQLRAAPTD